MEITWIVGGIEISNLDNRGWSLIPSSVVLARIYDDGPVVKNNKTILAEGFDIRKPSTLILKNVDDRYNGKYRFTAEAKFNHVESIVTVVVASKYHNTLYCRLGKI